MSETTPRTARPAHPARRRWCAAALAAAALAWTAGCTSVPGPSPFKGTELSATPLLGKFVWRDLVTDNPDAVKPFYAALFGWQYVDSRAFDAPYTLIQSGGQFIGGISRAQRPQPDQPVSQWLSFMSVADVDRAAQSTRAAGGRVIAGPRDLPKVGRGAVVIDPDGAPLGLLRSRIGDPADTAEPALHRFMWTDHLSRDPQTIAAFYASLAGFEVRRVDLAGQPQPYWVLVQGRERAGLLKNPIAVNRPIWLPYVRVADPAAAAARAAQLGGKVLLAPRGDLRGGTMALIADPTGAVLALQKWPL
ncbi:MAG TPA: VOC family protein [Rubrivivax sp.]|nr:VOC family protein [Rubrivivax sp.]